MTPEQHKSSIEAQLAQQAVNTMIQSLAITSAEVDKLREEIAALKAKYEPEPEVKPDA